jgi:hypothetical protein
MSDLFRCVGKSFCNKTTWLFVFLHDVAEERNINWRQFVTDIFSHVSIVWIRLMTYSSLLKLKVHIYNEKRGSISTSIVVPVTAIDNTHSTWHILLTVKCYHDEVQECVTWCWCQLYLLLSLTSNFVSVWYSKENLFCVQEDARGR